MASSGSGIRKNKHASTKTDQKKQENTTKRKQWKTQSDASWYFRKETTKRIKNKHPTNIKKHPTNNPRFP